MSFNWGSFRCSSPNEVGVPTNGSACSKISVPAIGSLLMTATCNSFSPIPSLGARNRGFLDNASALVLVFPE